MFLFEYFYQTFDFYYIIILQSLDTSIDHRLFDECEGISDMLGTHFAVHHILLEEGECISQSSASRLRDDTQCIIFSFQSFFFTDVFEPRYYIFDADLTKVESESARSDRLRHFVYLSRREDEFHMRRWLFESFQERIERSGREHMDFVDDVDFVFCLIGLESGTLDEVTDILDSVIARAIDLHDIEECIIIECSTIRTFVAGISTSRIETVQRFREDASTRRLPSPT